MSDPYRPLNFFYRAFVVIVLARLCLFFFFLAVAVAEPAALVLDEVAETTLEGPAETAGRESAKVAL